MLDSCIQQIWVRRVQRKHTTMIPNEYSVISFSKKKKKKHGYVQNLLKSYRSLYHVCARNIKT